MTGLEIFKVELISHNVIWVYNKDQSVSFEMVMDNTEGRDELMKSLNGELAKFFYGEVKRDHVNLVSEFEAEWQDW